MLNKFPMFIELAKSAVFGNESCYMFLRNDNILQIHMNEFITCGLIEAEFLLETLTKLSDGKKLPLLAIYSNFNTFSKEAIELVASHQITCADALVTQDDMLMRILATHYIERNKPIRPTQIFNDVEDALKWLQNYRPLNI